MLPRRITPAAKALFMGSLLLATPALAGGDGGGVRLDLDFSVFIQLGIFFVVFFMLKALVFQPYLTALDARAAKTTDAKAEAQAIKARAAELEARYHSGKADAAARANAERQALRVDGLGQKDRTVGEAREAATTEVAQARAKIEAEIEQARGQLMGQVDDIARLVVTKVMGREA
ncbi:MAG: ATP synthase F0 subunit B [Myxococcales bacterium]|nr:ATP synthase F0 subunit B [Myxococcales bacterium]